MGTTESEHTSGTLTPIAPGEGDKSSRTPTAEAPPADPSPGADITSKQPGKGRGTAWRTWWRQFRTEFYVGGPEKQVAQIYHISAILAVMGSVVAGLWAFGGSLFPEKLPTLPQIIAGTPETVIAPEPGPVPKLSIVVLPFVNLSGDAGQDYFADGITDSLTTDLSRALPGSFVVARETAFTYRGKAVDARRIGRELRVRYVLEGSTLLDGEQVRVNARLVDALLGNELWSERFDTARGQILQVQDQVVGRLSRAIGLQVISLAAQRGEREKSNSTEAIDLVLRGQATLNRPSSPATMMEARRLFEQALKLQPNNVDALGGAASTYIFEVLNDYYPSGNTERLERATPFVRHALELDDHDVIALKANAALLRAEGKFDEAIAAAKAVIDQNPGEPWAYKEVGLSMMYLGQANDALAWFEKAALYGPRDPGRWTWLGGKGQTLILLGRDSDAIASLQGAIEANPADTGDYAVLAAAYALAGRDEDARSTLAQYDRYRPGTTVSTFRSLSPVPLQRTDPGYRKQRERLKEGLRRAGMPE